MLNMLMSVFHLLKHYAAEISGCSFIICTKISDMLSQVVSSFPNLNKDGRWKDMLSGFWHKGTIDLFTYEKRRSPEKKIGSLTHAAHSRNVSRSDMLSNGGVTPDIWACDE